MAFITTGSINLRKYLQFVRTESRFKVWSLPFISMCKTKNPHVTHTHRHSTRDTHTHRHSTRDTYRAGVILDCINSNGMTRLQGLRDCFFIGECYEVSLEGGDCESNIRPRNNCLVPRRMRNSRRGGRKS